MRIISLVPNGTEILFALGAGDLRKRENRPAEDAGRRVPSGIYWPCGVMVQSPLPVSTRIVVLPSPRRAPTTLWPSLRRVASA
jgi:hypothetical protein